MKFRATRTVTLTHDDINILRTSNDETVKRLVERAFKDTIRDELADIMPAQDGNHFGGYLVDGYPGQIQPRRGGLYDGKGLWLSDAYDWSLVVDDDRACVLIAKRKD